MGWGDYIMTSGLVRRLKNQNPNLQILIKEPFNKTRQYKDIFYNNPYIVSSETLNEKLPFIKVPRILTGTRDEINNKIIWKKERVAEIGDFYTKDQETTFADENIKKIYEHWKTKNKKKPKGIIFISDTAKKNIIMEDKNIKYEHSINKEWGRKKWQEFINICSKNYILIKTSISKDDYIDGLYYVLCDFRSVFLLMRKCDFFIGNEGGLSHLWAITRKKGIVFFGHWIPPYLTGYPFHINLSTNLDNHCGSLKRCESCVDFFKNLDPEYINFLVEKNI